MAPGKDSESHGESAEGAPNETISNAGSSIEREDPTENPDFTISSAAILEPSEDDPLFKREKIKRPRKTYQAIMKSFNSTEVYANSDESVDDANSGQTDGRRSLCRNLLNGYKNLTYKIRNSKFIYFLQILIVFLSLTTMGMGKKYKESCPGSPILKDFALMTGLFGFVLVVMWILIKFCGDTDDKPCEGYTKLLILVTFISITVMLMLEIYNFTKLSPSFNPSTTTYCNETFYDFTYYKFIAALGIILVVVLLYIPDYVSLASNVTCADPATNRCYNRLEEESD